MPIEAYLPTSGASFGPEAGTNMGKALEEAVDILKIGPSDETKREAVARFIIKLAEIEGGVDAASLRGKAVMALARLMQRFDEFAQAALGSGDFFEFRLRLARLVGSSLEPEFEG